MKNLVQLHSFLCLLASVVLTLPASNFDNNRNIDIEASEPRAQASLFGFKFGGMIKPRLNSSPRSSTPFKSASPPSKPISKPSPSPVSTKKLDSNKNNKIPSPSSSKVKNVETKKNSQTSPGPSPSPSSGKKNKPDINKDLKSPSKNGENGSKSKAKEDKQKSPDKSTNQKKDRESQVKPKSSDGKDKAQELNTNQPVSDRNKKGKAADPKEEKSTNKRSRKGRSAKNIDGKNPLGGENNKDLDDLERVDIRDKHLGSKNLSDNGGRDQDPVNGRGRNFNGHNQPRNRDFDGQDQFNGFNNDFNNQDSFNNGMGGFNNQDQFGGGNFQNNRFGNSNRNSIFSSPGPLFNSPGDLIQVVPTIGQLFSRPNSSPMENNLSFNSPSNNFQSPGAGGSEFTNTPSDNSNNFASPTGGITSPESSPDNSRSFEPNLNEANIPLMRSSPSERTTHEPSSNFPDDSESEQQSDSTANGSPLDGSHSDQQRKSLHTLSKNSGSLGLMQQDKNDDARNRHASEPESNTHQDDEDDNESDGDKKNKNGSRPNHRDSENPFNHRASLTKPVADDDDDDDNS